MGVLKIQYLPQYTIQDYSSWEGEWELIHGIPYSMSPSPTSGHQRAGLSVMRVLRDALTQGRCSCELFYDLDWHISEDTAVRPDVLLLCGEKLRSDFVTRAPELVIEILSPSTQEKDRTLKAELYAEAGVVNYVLVDHLKKEIEVLLLANGKYHTNTSNTVNVGECMISPIWAQVFED